MAPFHRPAPPRGPAPSVDDLATFLRERRVTVLTGAGCSTDSGIPDYRGPNGTLRTRSPMRYQEFMGSADARRRYWSRSMVGWPRFSEAAPNPAHRALAALEAAGRAVGVITQNVDRLHQAGGSRRVIDLHGALARVVCTECGVLEDRWDLQDRLEGLNPGFRVRARRFVADGDADIDPAAERDFRVAACVTCGGVLKPDVVFFGENVPRDRVERCWRLYEEGEALLVVGSSLTVFSGRRFVLRAGKEGKPVAIVNLGETRGDDVAALKVEGAVGEVLGRVAERLGARAG